MGRFLGFLSWGLLFRLARGDILNFSKSSSTFYEKFDRFPFLTVTLIFSAFMEAFTQYLKYRQMKTYNIKKVPKDMENIVNAEEFMALNAYNREMMQFRIFSSLFNFCLSFIFVWAQPRIWIRSAEILGQTQPFQQGDVYQECKQSLVFVTILTVIKEIVGIPFSFYEDFVIEEKHGFNKKTFSLFVTDRIKSYFLQALIGTPILFLIIWVIHWGGPNFYIWLWGTTVGLVFLMMAIYPNFIAPLFNKFEPLHDQELKTKIEALCREVGFPLGKLYQVDGSKRSGHSNAYFYGLWRWKRIVLYDTLLHTNHAKILAILGHELGHWKMKHTRRMMVISFSQLFIIFYLYGLCMNSDGMYSSFGFEPVPKAVIIGLTLFMTIISPVTSVTSLFETMLSRKHEFEADAFSHGLGFATPLREGLIELHKDNKASLEPDPWYSWYHYSHPPLKERLAALLKLDDPAKKRT